jgi:hypothetical protein
MKEERVLYPSLDKLVTDQERDDLYEKMNPTSDELPKVCAVKGDAAEESSNEAYSFHRH